MAEIFIYYLIVQVWCCSLRYNEWALRRVRQISDLCHSWPRTHMKVLQTTRLESEKERTWRGILVWGALDFSVPDSLCLTRKT